MQPLIGYTYILYEISLFVNHKMSKKFPLLENFFSYVLVFGDFPQLDRELQRAKNPRFRGLRSGESPCHDVDAGCARLLARRSVLLRPFCALAVNDFRRQHKGRGARIYSSIRLRGLARAA